ncbi:hypothetical protein FC758_12405 [Clostridium botulinum]|nr:hypothetical protein [Clostridium botulinum]NFL58336.1 hypothetical protein [Clostridium botulinum]NFL62574.1 hypothetical protein [Clostridium botulinum]
MEVLTKEQFLKEKRAKPYKQRFAVKRVYKDSKTEDDKKTERISIRVSKSQKIYIENLAAKKGMNVSEFILDLIGGIKDE